MNSKFLFEVLVIAAAFLNCNSTVGEGTKIVVTTVYLNPGFFCGGGSEKYRNVRTLELQENKLVINESSTRSEIKSECVFVRN